MNCKICGSITNELNECPICGFIGSNCSNEVISLYENTINLKNNYDVFLKEKEENFILYNKQTLSEETISLLSNDIISGKEFSCKIEKLLNDAKELFQSTTEDDLRNVYNCLASISQIENLFYSTYYNKLEKIIKIYKQKTSLNE